MRLPRPLLPALVVLALSGAASGGDEPAPAPPATPEQQRRQREIELGKLRDALPETARPALALLDEFRDREFRVWSTLRDRVAAQGKAAVPALRIHLKELDWEARAFAASCLARIADPETAADLSDAWGAETFAEARRQIVLALSETRAPSSLPTLAAAAADPDPGVRLAGVRALGRIRDEKVVAELRKRVDDEERDVRYEARGALASMGDEKTLEALLKEAQGLVDDREARRKNSEPPEDNDVRYSQYLLGLALARARTKPIDALLVAAVLAEKPWDNKDFFRMGAAEGLASRGDRYEEVHPVILQGIGHRDDKVRVACSYAAGFARDAALLPRLRAALQDSQLDVRHNAVVALGRIGGPEAAKALKGALADRAGEVRIGAVRALADIDLPEATEALVLAARDSRYMIRVQAARALAGRTAGPGVEEALLRCAREADYGVRAQALASLAHGAATPGVLDAAEGGLGDADHGVRAAACLCLATLSDRAAVAARENAIRRIVSLYLAASEEPRTVRAALECLDSVRAPACVPPLLDALGDPSEGARDRANRGLQKVSETTRNFDPKGSDSERAAAAKRWRAWWEEQGGKLAPRGARSRIAVTGDFLEAARDLKWRGLDICLLFDSTGSMAALISAAKERIDEIIRQLGLLLPSIRVSVYTYRDAGDDYVFYGTPLTYDTWKLTGFLQTAVHGQGGDIPEAVYASVKNATKSLRWRPEAHKVVVYAGDAPHHPEEEQAFLKHAKEWFTKDNRAVLHALFTDTNRRSLDIKARDKRIDSSKIRMPFFEKYKLTAEAGRGRAVLLDDESALIKEMLVLTFGEAWRVDIENLLDFEV